MHEPLKNCPFCGEAAKHSFNSLYGDMSMASCKSCGATAYAPKWNRRAVLAKWGTPATGGEPAGTVGYTVHGTQYVNWRTKPPAHGTPLYTTPQPTHAQAGAVPLTVEQVNAILLEAGYGSYNAPVPERAAFISGLRHSERAHGIGETP